MIFFIFGIIAKDGKHKPELELEIAFWNYLWREQVHVYKAETSFFPGSVSNLMDIPGYGDRCGAGLFYARCSFEN